MAHPPPQDPGDTGVGPPSQAQLRTIDQLDIDIFCDVELIQGGRFSDILYGYCHSLGESVALKRLRVPCDGDGVAQDRDLRIFEEEATIWQALEHPHVLPLRGVYSCPMGFTYLVSPYMHNGDLMTYLKRNPLVDRRGLLCDIASALAYLHSLDIVHGDIKARNILVSQEGEVRLCDFGLSKFSSWATSEGRKGAGTIRWQGPELLFDESKTFKSDVYAFGITIYEVLSGNLPFGQASDGAIVYNVVLRNLRPPCLPTHSLTGVSYVAIWEIAKRCWSRFRDKRPDMVEVWESLEVEVFPETLRSMRQRTRPSLQGHGARNRTASSPVLRAHTLDDTDDEGEEEPEHPLRRYTIDNPTLGRTLAFTDGELSPEVDFDDEFIPWYNRDANLDEEDDLEDEQLITPPESPVLGASVAPDESQGGLLPQLDDLQLDGLLVDDTASELCLRFRVL